MAKALLQLIRVSLSFAIAYRDFELKFIYLHSQLKISKMYLICSFYLHNKMVKIYKYIFYFKVKLSFKYIVIKAERYAFHILTVFLSLSLSFSCVRKDSLNKFF